MPDITLTIMIDEEVARWFAAGDFSNDWVSQTAKAIAAALPPEPPKEGEVWRRKIGGDEAEVGPMKWDRFLMRDVRVNDAWSVALHDLLTDWTKVR